MNSWIDERRLERLGPRDIRIALYLTPVRFMVNTENMMFSGNCFVNQSSTVTGGHHVVELSRVLVDVLGM